MAWKCEERQVCRSVNWSFLNPGNHPPDTDNDRHPGRGGGRKAASFRRGKGSVPQMPGREFGEDALLDSLLPFRTDKTKFYHLLHRRVCHHFEAFSRKGVGSPKTCPRHKRVADAALTFRKLATMAMMFTCRRHASGAPAPPTKVGGSGAGHKRQDKTH